MKARRNATVFECSFVYLAALLASGLYPIGLVNAAPGVNAAPRGNVAPGVNRAPVANSMRYNPTTNTSFNYRIDAARFSVLQAELLRNNIDVSHFFTQVDHLSVTTQDMFRKLDFTALGLQPNAALYGCVSDVFDPRKCIDTFSIGIDLPPGVAASIGEDFLKNVSCSYVLDEKAVLSLPGPDREVLFQQLAPLMSPEFRLSIGTSPGQLAWETIRDTMEIKLTDIFGESAKDGGAGTGSGGPADGEGPHSGGSGDGGRGPSPTPPAYTPPVPPSPPQIRAVLLWHCSLRDSRLCGRLDRCILDTQEIARRIAARQTDINVLAKSLAEQASIRNSDDLCQLIEMARRVNQNAIANVEMLNSLFNKSNLLQAQIKNVGLMPQDKSAGEELAVDLSETTEKMEENARTLDEVYEKLKAKS